MYDAHHPPQQDPKIHPSAWIAPNATIVGDATIGPDSRIMYGVVLNAEGGSIE